METMAESKELEPGAPGKARSVHQRRLYHYRARAVDASTGAFLSRDPIWTWGSLYSYVGNRPVDRIDPTGAQFVEALVKINTPIVFGSALLASSGPEGREIVASVINSDVLGFDPNLGGPAEVRNGKVYFDPSYLRGLTRLWGTRDGKLHLIGRCEFAILLVHEYLHLKKGFLHEGMTHLAARATIRRLLPQCADALNRDMIYGWREYLSAVNRNYEPNELSPQDAEWIVAVWLGMDGESANGRPQPKVRGRYLGFPIVFSAGPGDPNGAGMLGVPGDSREVKVNRLDRALHNLGHYMTNVRSSPSRRSFEIQFIIGGGRSITTPNSNRVMSIQKNQ